MASHVFFSLEPSLLPVAAAAAPAAGDGGRRRGRRRADGRFRPSPAIHPGRPELASHLMLPNELDIQGFMERLDGLTNDVQEMLLHQRRRQRSSTANGGGGDGGARERMATVDHLKRLCIDHYFQDEVDGAMDAHLEELAHGGDLLDATLAFRLMREAGHHVSPDEVLGRFTDGNGDFSMAYSKDIRGLLSLQDISHMNIGAEASLYKAKEFTSRNLQSAIDYLEPGLARYVRQSLEHPYHVSLMQYKARHHLSYLQTLPTRCTAMEELALADFKLNKLLHQMEMQEIKRWWMNLGLAQEIPVARDQVQKWYVWIMTAFQGASFSRYRIELTKIASFVYIMDDIFDLVSTQEERSCFTQAIKMWDFAAADSLPSCMRSCYRAIYTVTNDIADMVEREHGVNPINHLKKAWAVLFDGLMTEAKWLTYSHVPSSEDYLRNGVITSGVPLMFLHLLFMLGHDAAELIDNIPPVISCPAKIFRLWDDIGNAKEGLDGSYKELYLRENPGLAASEAEEHMRGLITREWEKLNRESFFSGKAFPASFTQAALNAARMVGVMHGHDGEQRLPVLEDYLRMLLF